MKAPSIGFVVFLFLLVAGMVHIACFYPQLPENVASHFGPDGKPNDWSTKNAFMGIYAGTFFATAAILLGVSLVLPKLPASMVSLPNKDYWLAPERKKETYIFISSYLTWFATVTMVLLMSCMHITFRVNLGQEQNPGTSFWIVIISYGVFTAAWCVALLWRFRKPDNTHDAPGKPSG